MTVTTTARTRWALALAILGASAATVGTAIFHSNRNEM